MVNNVSFGNNYPQRYPSDVDYASAYNPQQNYNNVAFGNGVNLQQNSKDIENLVKYGTGAVIVEQTPGPFEGMGLMLGISGAMEAFKGIGWLRKSYKNAVPEGLTGDALKTAQKAASPFSKGGWFKGASYTEAGKNIKSAWATYKAGVDVEMAALKATGGITSKAGLQSVLNNQSAKTIIDSIPTGDKFTKLNGETQKLYNSAKEAANLAKTTNSKEAFKTADKALAEARAMSHGQIKPTSWLGKIGKFFSKITGISKLNGAVKNLATKSPLTAKLLKHGKGNGIFLAITAGLEVFTQIIPTFSQLGVKKGFKQLFKSAVKTAANIGGWIAGSAVGTPAGAALGVAIGAVGGPVGMAIGGMLGGICGMIGGFIGSWAATKVADKIVGKNELDIAKEEQAKVLTEKASNDPKAVQEIMAAAAQRLESEGQTSDDAKIAFGSLNKLKQVLPAQTVASPATTTPTAAPATPSFQGQSAVNQFVSNPFSTGMNRQGFDQQSYMDKDFMAMSNGLV